MYNIPNTYWKCIFRSIRFSIFQDTKYTLIAFFKVNHVVCYDCLCNHANSQILFHRMVTLYGWMHFVTCWLKESVVKHVCKLTTSLFGFTTVLSLWWKCLCFERRSLYSNGPRPVGVQRGMIMTRMKVTCYDTSWVVLYEFCFFRVSGRTGVYCL